MAEAFTPVETQEALDALLSERETAVRGEYADYETLKAANAEQAATIQRYERAETQRKVASEVGIPPDLAGRIAGNTEAEMKADAQTLLAALHAQKKAPPMRDPESKPTGNSALRALLSGLK
jgi:hypothetical protein